MPPVIRLLPVAAALMLGLTAAAQSAKPGLWEVTSKIGGNPELERAQAELQKQLAAMPPEQRKMMEQMMAGHGMQMGMAGGATTMRFCLSKEMAERQELPVQTEGDCTTTITERSPRSMKMSFRCTNPPSSGEGVWSFDGDARYTMKMVTHSTVQGRPQRMTIDGSGRWLGADCGSLKPIQPSKR